MNGYIDELTGSLSGVFADEVLFQLVPLAEKQTTFEVVGSRFAVKPDPIDPAVAAWQVVIDRCQTRKDVIYHFWEITNCKLMKHIERPVLAALRKRAAELGYHYEYGVWKTRK